MIFRFSSHDCRAGKLTTPLMRQFLGIELQPAILTEMAALPEPPAAEVSKNGAFCIKMRKFRIKNEELCI